MRTALFVAASIGLASASPSTITMKNQGSTLVFDAGVDSETAVSSDSAARMNELLQGSDTGYGRLLRHSHWSLHVRGMIGRG